MAIDIQKDQKNKESVNVELQGIDLINNPILNKGNSFSAEEKKNLKLQGLLPFATLTREQEIERSYNCLKQKETDLEKHLYLRNLQDKNETLFYALINSHLEETFPLIYTPTVGKACQQFSHIYERPRGLFISYPEREHIDEILSSRDFDDVEVIVVTDGERILGLGDLGVGGMPIPIGKLSLYTACAGIPPYKTLPITLDVGTNNESLLNDPLYLGWRNKRITREAYDAFIDMFIQSVKKRFPKILLQWEDFGRENALRLLQHYQDKICCFNDDIQGTAAIVVAALLSANNTLKVPLSQHKIVIMGAGAASAGIANLIVEAMLEEGTPRETAYNNIFMLNRNGLITDQRVNLDYQKSFVKQLGSLSNWTIKDKNNISLLETVTNTKATILIGVSTQGGIFTKDIIEQLARNCERPIVFPLSNPTSKAEAHPHDVLDWTGGKAIVGAGSPFPPYIKGEHSRRIDQINNCYIFPGLGLGLRALDATCVTDRMFLVVARALSKQSPSIDDPKGNLLPPISKIREISRQIAIAVGEEIKETGLTNIQNLSSEKIVELIDQYMWEADYIPYRKKQRIKNHLLECDLWN